MLKDLNTILDDPKATNELDVYFKLLIIEWENFFVFSPIPKLWVLIDVLDNYIIIDRKRRVKQACHLMLMGVTEVKNMKKQRK